jgi:hypothetical protein
MSFDIGVVVQNLGEEAIGQAGEPVGLDQEQSVRVARALAAHAGLGGEEAVRAAAADTNLSEDVVSSMLQKLIEIGKEKVLEEGPVADAIEGAKDQAMDAARGLLGGMFGRK